MKLSEVKIGKTFTVAGIEFIKFTDEDGVCAVVSKDILFNSEFGKNNNFAESKILEELKNKILAKYEREIGAENIKEFELNLTSLDGLDTYGKITTKIGLPTFDFYRENVKIFDKYKVSDWWWTATPLTTAKHNCTTAVKCVSPSGYVSNSCNGNYYSFGVRPFCILNSDIFVS